MRMDAAIDAMQSYGFRRELIVTTVKELLNVGLFCFWKEIGSWVFKN